LKKESWDIPGGMTKGLKQRKKPRSAAKGDLRSAEEGRIRENKDCGVNWLREEDPYQGINQAFKGRPIKGTEEIKDFWKGVFDLLVNIGEIFEELPWGGKRSMRES